MLSEASKGFGMQLRIARVRRNLTQRELSKLILTPQYIVSLWETGRSSPNSTSLKKLKGFLGADKELFIAWKQLLKKRGRPKGIKG